MNSLCSATICLAVALCPAAGLHAQAATAEHASPSVLNLTVKDLTPKFMAFFGQATRENASPERRWELWKKNYDFAAVPPTAQGEAMAKQMLTEAWPRYPAAIGVIGKGAAGLTPDPHATFQAIAGLLRPSEPVSVTLLVYVGGFENNAFTSASDGKITTALAIEGDPDLREFLMTHELTHAVHIGIGSFSGGWIRTIGTTVVTEGLAMRVTQQLVKRPTEASYVERRPGWLAEATSHRNEILKDVKAAVASDKGEDVMRYTMGKGPSGIEGEAYYAGWLVVGYWLDHGMSFAEIARIPEARMPERVNDAIDKLLH